MNEHDRQGAGDPQQLHQGHAAGGQDGVRSKAHDFSCKITATVFITAPQRTSIRTSVHPNCCRLFWNAARRGRASALSALIDMSTPMRRVCSGCCAYPVSGDPAAAPPRRPMNSRRFMRLPGSTLKLPDYQMSYAALKLLMHRNRAALARTAKGHQRACPLPGRHG